MERRKPKAAAERRGGAIPHVNRSERRRRASKKLHKRNRGNYFPHTSKQVLCIPSGCAVLDGVLCGGWALGRVTNIVGDKSSGKTLLAIEACANFARIAPKGKGRIWYRESEAAFDEDYAIQLGLPIERVNFGPKGMESQWDTVEDIFEDLQKKLDILERTGEFGLYVIDSLDALSTRVELDRKIDQGTYGQEKPKLMGQIFRRLVRRVKKSKMCVLVISQTRDKIGVVFGEKHTRSGGKALDFYASVIIWLHHIKTLTQTINGIKQAKGVRIMAKTKKNKLGNPFRSCDFDIRFGYGMLDLEASLDWLAKAKRLHRVGLKPRGLEAFIRATRRAPRAERLEIHAEVRDAVLGVWKEMAQRMLPKESKY
jgi:recombination protein RecA